MGIQSKMGGKFHLKLNTGNRPIANKYREGKMKRTLKRELKGLEIAKREPLGGSVAGVDITRGGNAPGIVCALLVSISCAAGSAGGGKVSGSWAHAWGACCYSPPSPVPGARLRKDTNHVQFPGGVTKLGRRTATTACSSRGAPRPGLLPAGSVARMLTKCTQSTRLETRTKESNICASIRVANPGAQ